MVHIAIDLEVGIDSLVFLGNVHVLRLGTLSDVSDTALGLRLFLVVHHNLLLGAAPINQHSSTHLQRSGAFG